MYDYRAPVQDIKFLLHNVLKISQHSELPSYSEASEDIVDGVVDEIARFVESELAPLRRSADEQGCTLKDGEVTTPDGFKDVYEQYWQSGWVGLANNPEFGGQGLPFLLSKVVDELICSSNVAFSLYPGLTIGATEAIEAHGTDEQKTQYLHKLATGEWMGTMCITEPHAGSDIGLARTKAEPQADGSYKITGNKIFITSGEHNMTDNIIHYVLARLPDAPAGVKGLSTFIVPKFILDENNAPGERNTVTCTSIEEKMGIHGSCTCSLSFDGAVGYLAGAPNQGIQNMFTMMNAERIMVGYQGLGQMELAAQLATAYAKDRVQGTPLTSREPVAIVEHPDVRRMLLLMKSQTAAGRLMAYETAVHVDLAKEHPDAAVREEAQDWVELTTPMVKAYLTDSAVEFGSMAIQTYGGHGFIRESGVEQIMRDAKILCLYEGTNGIQAMDLARRKLLLNNGRLPQRFFDRVDALLTSTADNAELSYITKPLSAAVEQVRSTTAWMQNCFKGNPNDAGAGAVDYLRAFSLTMLGYNWLRMVQALDGQPADFAQSQQVQARFFAQRLLPQVAGLCDIAQMGSDSLMELTADQM